MNQFRDAHLFMALVLLTCTSTFAEQKLSGSTGECMNQANENCDKASGDVDQNNLMQMRVGVQRDGLSVDGPAKSFLEEDLGSLDEAHYKAFDSTYSFDENCNKSFQHFADMHHLNKQLNAAELEAFQLHACQEMRELLQDAHANKTSKMWKVFLRKALQDQKPGFSQQMLDKLKHMNLSWQTVEAPPSLSLKDMMNRLGADESQDQEDDDLDTGPEGGGPSFVQREALAGPRFKVDPKIQKSFDARTKWPKCASVFTYVRDQGNCGSCWAQAAAGVMDGRLCVSTDGAFQSRISASFVASCWNYKNRDGCKGGNPARVLHIAGHHGAPTEGCFPPLQGMGDALKHFNGNTGSTPKCPAGCSSDVGYSYPRSLNQDRFFSNGLHFMRNESFNDNLRNAQLLLLESGPVDLNFAVYSDLFSYSDGYYERSSSARVGMHAVFCIGWEIFAREIQNAPDETAIYFTCVNSWGIDWGDNGLFKVDVNDKLMHAHFVTPVKFPGAQDALPVPKVNDPKISDRNPPATCTKRYSVNVCGTCRESRQCRCSNGVGWCNETIKKCQCPDEVPELELKCGQTYIPIALTSTTTTMHGQEATTTTTIRDNRLVFTPDASALRLKSGTCNVNAGCATSPGFDSGAYGDEEECEMVVQSGFKLHVEKLATESGWDELKFDWLKDAHGNIIKISGDAEQAEIVDGKDTAQDGIVSWKSDDMTTDEGWKICVGTWEPCVANCSQPPTPAPAGSSSGTGTGSGSGGGLNGDLEFQASDGAVTLTSGTCIVDAGCAASPGFDSGSYGTNEACLLTVQEGFQLHVETFQTEADYDVLKVDWLTGDTGDEVVLSGGSDQASVIEGKDTAQDGTISWSSDASVHNAGWKICVGKFVHPMTATTIMTTVAIALTSTVGIAPTTTTATTTPYPSIDVFQDRKAVLPTCEEGVPFNYKPNPGPNPAPGYHLADWGTVAKCASPAGIEELQKTYKKWALENPEQAKLLQSTSEYGHDVSDADLLRFGDDLVEDKSLTTERRSAAVVGQGRTRSVGEKPWECSTHRRRRQHWSGWDDGRTLSDNVVRKVEVFGCTAGYFDPSVKALVDSAGVDYALYDLCESDPSVDYFTCRAEEVGLVRDYEGFKEHLLMSRYHAIVCGYVFITIETMSQYKSNLLELMRSCMNGSLPLPAFPKQWTEPGADDYECLLYLNHANCGGNAELRPWLLNYSTELQLPIIQPPENWTWYNSMGFTNAPTIVGFKGGKFCGKVWCTRGCEDFNIHDQVLFFKDCHQPDFDVMKHGRWPWY